MSLAGKVAIVTGASRGIGQATARVLASRGARVVVNYLRCEEGARQVVMGAQAGAAIAVRADVRDPLDVRTLVEQALQAFGRVDVLVNNAHAPYEGRFFEEAAWEEFQREIDTVLKGTFQMVQAVLPAMKRQGGGTIINIGSTMTHHVLPRHSMYITAKHGLVGLTKCLAVELGKYGIRVNMVTPGPVDTDHNAKLPPSLMEKLAHETPLYGRIGRPEDIAPAIAMMADDDAAFVTGANMLVCAGHTIV